MNSTFDFLQSLSNEKPRGVHLFVDDDADISLSFLLDSFPSSEFSKEVHRLLVQNVKLKENEKVTLFLLSELFKYIITLVVRYKVEDPDTMEKLRRLNELSHELVGAIGESDKP